MGEYHPEAPARLDAISDYLLATGLDCALQFQEAPLVTQEQLLRVHPQSHIDHVTRESPKEGIHHLDPDTAMSPGTLAAALRAAGAGCLAVDMVLAGKATNAFCSVRPPGHHAERVSAMGFCFFNNIAVAAAHALSAGGLQRVAIIDFDVHHGNGTEDIFAGNEQVLMVGMFQHPFYPYSGTDNPAFNMLNVPVPAGTRGPQFRELVVEKWLPRLREFAPQMIFVSAGFDAHYDDDMASLGLVESDYAFVTRELVAVASETANGRIVSMLEGGYVLDALARSVAAHIRVLADV